MKIKITCRVEDILKFDIRFFNFN